MNDLKSGIEQMIQDATAKSKHPTEYKGVEQTPFGHVYNFNSQSITDLKEEMKSFGKKVDDSKNYGWSYTTPEGDEAYAETFEDAYNQILNWK